MDSYYDDGGCCIVHPDSSDLILTGGKGPLTQTNWSFVISISHDGGTKWTRINPTPDSAGFCRALAVARSQTNVIYAGGNVAGGGAVYVSTDFGSTWTRTATAPTDTVYSLEVDPADPAMALAATPSGLFRTTNSGATWTNLHGGDLRAAVQFPGSRDTLIGGGAAGIVISTDGGSSWNKLNAGLDSRAVTALKFAEHGDIYLIAGTTGGSCYAWQFSAGLAEGPSLSPAGNRQLSTVVHGVLILPEAASPKPQAASLLDASGRRVLTLRPGANDVRSLSPGIYFVRQPPSDKREASSVNKVTVTR
jgi:photosystem II stability/assembly factor-like uncharacterized protein